jgi:hypothetical protein
MTGIEKFLVWLDKYGADAAEEYALTGKDDPEHKISVGAELDAICLCQDKAKELLAEEQAHGCINADDCEYAKTLIEGIEYWRGRAQKPTTK